MNRTMVISAVVSAYVTAAATSFALGFFLAPREASGFSSGVVFGLHKPGEGAGGAPDVPAGLTRAWPVQKHAAPAGGAGIPVVPPSGA
jgi:hypothetical protein